jgi:predicted dehydrogenase
MTVRIGQIGVQHVHASGKAQALIRENGVDFVGVFEPDDKLRAEAQASEAWAGVKWLDTAGSLLEDRDLQAVFIETHPLHTQYWVRQALNAGKHVHCDKARGHRWRSFAIWWDWPRRGGSSCSRATSSATTRGWDLP